MSKQIKSWNADMVESNDHIDVMEGVEDTQAEVDDPLFTAQEQRVLDLYARMEELQLENILLKSQVTLSQGKVTGTSYTPYSLISYRGN
jgi:hypothetical protein